MVECSGAVRLVSLQQTKLFFVRLCCIINKQNSLLGNSAHAVRLWICWVLLKRACCVFFVEPALPTLSPIRKKPGSPAPQTVYRVTPHPIHLQIAPLTLPRGSYSCVLGLGGAPNAITSFSFAEDFLRAWRNCVCSMLKISSLWISGLPQVHTWWRYVWPNSHTKPFREVQQGQYNSGGAMRLG